jgi:hypothetical protein
MLKMVLLRPVNQEDRTLKDPRYTVIEFIDADDDPDRALEPLSADYVVAKVIRLTEFQSEVLSPTRNVGIDPLIELVWPYEG